MSTIPPTMMINPYTPYTRPAQVMQGNVNQCAGRLKLEGRGSIHAKPDTAVVVLGVITENRQLRAAQEENTRKVTQVLNTLKALGIADKDIHTRSYQAEPLYDFIEGKQVFRGYRVLHSLEINVREIAKVGEIIDKSVESGANIVNSINFTVSDMSRLYQQALNAAIDDAQTKAAAVGRKLNVTMNPIPVQVIEQSRPPAVPIPYTAMQTAVTTPIQPGQIEVTAQIEALFLYKYS